MASITSRRSFLLKASAMAMLAACSTSAKPSGPAPSIPTPPPTPAPVSSAFPMITDMAQRLDVAKAKALYKHGARTVFRYYSHLPPSLPGKDLQPEEARIILGEGLSIGSVFQHYNNCFRTFDNAWGREDAEQALRMAEAAGQPEGSAVYFGVDADWPYAALRDPILKYFEDVKQVFDRANIAVGIYSNGCICNAVREKELAKYFWLSGSTGHSGTQAFYNTGKWTMFQNALDIVPVEVGFGVDTNIANPTTNGFFGQWNDRGAMLASHLAGDAQSVFMSRSFLKANTDIKASADPAAATVGSVLKDRNVRSIERAGDWSRIMTQEGGRRGTADAITGWVPASALAPMDRFPDNTSNYGLCGAPTAVSDTTKYQNCDRATSRLR